MQAQRAAQRRFDRAPQRAEQWSKRYTTWQRESNRLQEDNQRARSGRGKNPRLPELLDSQRTAWLTGYFGCSDKIDTRSTDVEGTGDSKVQLDMSGNGMVAAIEDLHRQCEAAKLELDKTNSLLDVGKDDVQEETLESPRLKSIVSSSESDTGRSAKSSGKRQTASSRNQHRKALRQKKRDAILSELNDQLVVGEKAQEESERKHLAVNTQYDAKYRNACEPVLRKLEPLRAQLAAVVQEHKTCIGERSALDVQLKVYQAEILELEKSKSQRLADELRDVESERTQAESEVQELRCERWKSFCEAILNIETLRALEVAEAEFSAGAASESVNKK